ncbi:uncharacterized protein BX663DRAFT_436127 [Cokeromyces recurvatus]|uniref:uncharacterized protein n=1 Tax=Cokeromyces recurvatus TaxID=90255 RepID=UPI002220CDAA|nr:uncharacterized protein BX663DRAFT_436127 [Cokeromyces recurvatus]KAI7902151.1 hypothetical protein BX663DRAFT_436127 [Cokeromyces recurvatus]
MTFGTDLKDQIPSIVKYVGDGIQSLYQFRNFIRDRATIEREYAQKLESLTKKYKTGQTSRRFMPGNGGELHHQEEKDWENLSSTTSSTWSQLLDQTMLVAKSRHQFVDDLNNVIVDSLKNVATRKEDAKKKDKAKQTYDEACMEIENIKTKLNKSNEKEKLQRQLDAAFLNCDNKKNLYLLSIAVANAERTKYFDVDTPALSDCHDESLYSIEQLDPAVDAAVFTQNALNSTDTTTENATNIPFAFIPWNGGANAAETIIDRDANLVSSEAAVIYLNNKLVKDRKMLDSLDDALSKATDEMKLMDMIRDITLLSTQKTRISSEIDLIIQNIGDNGLKVQGHDFKPSSFTIPTTCDYCNSTIWGLNKGLTCKACGLNCHTRCEMKIAPNCSQKKGQVNPQPALSIGTTKLNRQASINSVSNSVVSSASSPIHTNPDAPTFTTEINTFDIRAIYSYEAQNTDELNITAGDLLKIIESNDGSGWIKAQLRDQQVGLIPANYIEYINHPEESSSYIQTNKEDSYERVVALYDFKAVNAEELNLNQGDIIIVTKKDDGGWWEGSLNGQSGIFPSNYVGPYTE